MLVEIGERQGKAAQALAQAAFPKADVSILPDLAGKDRVLQIALRRLMFERYSAHLTKPGRNDVTASG